MFRKKWFRISSIAASLALTATLLLYLFLPGAVSPRINYLSFGVSIAEAAAGEVNSLRTANSKTIFLGGNSFTWDGSLGKIHRWDGTAYQDIDNSFVPATAPWDWWMPGADYTIRLVENFTAGQILQFEKQGETVEFQPMALEWTNDLSQIQQISMPQNVVPVITNPEMDLLPAVGVLNPQGTIRWNDAYGSGIDFQWQATATRLAKILEINSLGNLPVPQQYILDGGNPVLRFNLIFAPPNARVMDIIVDGQIWNRTSDAQTFDIIEFRSGGEVLWGFMPLRYWGSNPDSEDNTGQSVATLEKRGNKLYISVRIPYSWLQTAVYPVFIDTDIDETVAASADDASEKAAGSVSIVLTYNCMGNFQGYNHSGQRFASVTIPDGATIDAAYLTWRALLSDSGSVGGDLWGEDTATPAQYTTTDNDITDRTKTTASVTAGSTEFGSWTGGTDYNSPSIVSIVEELMASYSYASGNAMAIMWIWTSETGERLAQSWDDSGTNPPKLHIGYTSGASPDFTNAPSSIAFGTVATSAQLWSDGSAPTFPLDDAECYFTITSTSSASIDIDVKATNFTGGVGWTLASSPGSNIVTLKVGKSGDANEAAMVVLTTTDQAFIASLAASGVIKWELHMETPTAHTDGALKTSTLTLTASLS